MNAREMHYDFKQKLNKIDSNQNRNLKVPEIDWKLNEAQELIVKMIAQPRLAKQYGFEINQRSIDDIRTIVINQSLGQNNCLAVSSFDTSSFIATLPGEYWFFVSGKAYATKGACQNKRLSLREVQHEDEDDISPFDKSSFEWRVSNIRFNSQGIRVFTDGTYTIEKLCIDYLKRPRLIHNAQDFDGGTYTTLTGQVLTGTQSSELPEGVHREIVDLAVMITAGDLSSPDFSVKQHKVQLTKQ
jgi:hypothetical protein